jgi:hypothetical protein
VGGACARESAAEPLPAEGRLELGLILASYSLAQPWRHGARPAFDEDDDAERDENLS